MSARSMYDIKFAESTGEEKNIVRELCKSIATFSPVDDLEEFDKIFITATIAQNGNFFYTSFLHNGMVFFGFDFFEDNAKDFILLGSKENAPHWSTTSTYSYGSYYLYHKPSKSFVRTSVDSSWRVSILNFCSPNTSLEFREFVKKTVEKYGVTVKAEYTNYIWLLSSSSSGVQWSQHRLSTSDTNMSDDALQTNYGCDFENIHKGVVDSLSKSDKGVYIFNGPPGTGKTTYIKHLIGTIKKNFLYVPERLIDQISDPSFINMLLQKPNSILILEDAERAIRKRTGKDATSAVSNILNMSDGIIGAVLKMPIIMTFNADVEDIDPAVLRNGRCLFRHEFGPLPVKDAKILAKKLGKNIDFKGKKSMTLADIYNSN